MAFSDFYMGGTGSSNLNAGSSAGAAVYSSTSGTFDGTSVYTPSDGQTTSSLVSVGNWVSIFPTANTTTPCVAQVTVVGAGVNGTITVSTTVKYGTLPGAVACQCRAGGAWADLGMLASGVALNTGTVPVSTRINVIASGTYTNTTTSRTFGLVGTTLLPVWWRGYQTTIGDQDGNNTAVAGTNIPSFTWTTGVFTIGSTAADYCIFSNIDFTSACVAANGAFFISCGAAVFYGCRFTCTGANANSSAIQVSSSVNVIAFVRCWFKATTTATRCVYVANSTANLFRGCTVTGGIAGLETGTGANTIANCVFDSQAGDAIKVAGGAASILDCSIYNPTGNGIEFTSVSGSGSVVANCYFSTIGSGKFAINNSSGTNTSIIKVIGNAYFPSPGGTVTGLGDFPLIFDNGTLGSEAFSAPAAQTFNILPVGQGIGNPSTFENTSLYRSYEDVGACQHLATGGPTGQILRVSGQHFMAG